MHVRMRRRLLAIGLVATVLAGCSGSTEGKFGGDLYATSCARCHAPDGAGGIGPPLGPGSEASDLTDAQLRETVRVGPGTMPSFARLSDAQLDSLVEFIRSLD